jgi:hypothetical protein
MKKLLVLTAIILIFSLAGCKKNTTEYSPVKDVYTIAVLSDIHYMDPSLLVDTGKAFSDYLVMNGKLLAASDAIMQEAVAELIQARPDLVLIPGDLTKDGELVSHVSVHLYLQQLIQAGIKVRVIVGNHDIWNPHSYEYNGAKSNRVQNIGPDKFRSIYSDCGYSDALYTDPYSLSYVSEPLPGLWLLAIDCCKYEDVYDTAYTAGAIRPGTMKWIQDRLAEAAKQGKTVFGMMHHGLVEHFEGQHTYFHDFLVDNYDTVSNSLMKAGLTIMFTGHFHASDIVQHPNPYGNMPLYDIETGSIVVYPCSYRLVSYTRDSELSVTTKFITNVNYSGIPSHQTFIQYADSLTRVAADTLFTTTDTTLFPLDHAWLVGHCQAPALMAHMAGDEDKSKEDTLKISNVVAIAGPKAWWVPGFCNSLWTDLTPTDNSLTIQLKSGVSHK